ncbi:bile acid:sodium symporter family protein [Candidatus Latescibacterota bacterium]
MEDTTIKKVYLWISAIALIAEILVLTIGKGSSAVSGILLFAMFFLFAMYCRKTPLLKGVSFTFQIFAFVSFTMYFPQLFTNWGFNTSVLIVPSVQLIMFGMGTKLSISDFVREFKRPQNIITGSVLIYTIMPLAALLIIKVTEFPAEVAAGIILIGACPAGAASNVMTYLAKGNIALALSITSLSTLIAPVVTPFIMKIFAGRLMDVNFLNMMISILNMIFVPIGAGLIANKILFGKAEILKKAGPMVALSIGCMIIGIISIFIPFSENLQALQSGLVLVSILIGIVIITKVIVDAMNGPENWMDRVLPILSLTAIMMYIIIVAAHNKDTLLNIGAAVFIAAIAHNFLGFILGYSAAKVLRLNERDTRTFTIEVGLKNSGLGVGLAFDVLKSQSASLASLIFGTWMNISGSTLANYWRLHPPKDAESGSTPE